MKKLFLILITAVIMTACGYSAPPKPSSGSKFHYRVVVIDKCEYIISNYDAGGYQGYGYMAHKGNCKFCKARRAHGNH